MNAFYPVFALVSDGFILVSGVVYGLVILARKRERHETTARIVREWHDEVRGKDI